MFGLAIHRICVPERELSGKRKTGIGQSSGFVDHDRTRANLNRGRPGLNVGSGPPLNPPLMDLVLDRREHQYPAT